jgi:hypothetical protein
MFKKLFMTLLLFFSIFTHVVKAEDFFCKDSKEVSELGNFVNLLNQKIKNSAPKTSDSLAPVVCATWGNTLKQITSSSLNAYSSLAEIYAKNDDITNQNRDVTYTNGKSAVITELMYCVADALQTTAKAKENSSLMKWRDKKTVKNFLLMVAMSYEFEGVKNSDILTEAVLEKIYNWYSKRLASDVKEEETPVIGRLSGQHSSSNDLNKKSSWKHFVACNVGALVAVVCLVNQKLMLESDKGDIRARACLNDPSAQLELFAEWGIATCVAGNSLYYVYNKLVGNK